MTCKERYSLSEGNLLFGERVLGLASDVYVDGAQGALVLLAKQHGWATVVQLKVGDYVLVNAAQQVMCVEEKRLADLLASYTSRRLQRQLRHLLLACDIPVLALRMDEMSTYRLEVEYLGVLAELAKWQMLGGYLAVLPSTDAFVVPALRELAAVLGPPTRSTLSIIAGSDNARKDAPYLTPQARALMRLLDGVGAKTAERIMSHFENDMVRALRAPDDELRAAGAHKNVIARLREVVCTTSSNV